MLTCGTPWLDADLVGVKRDLSDRLLSDVVLRRRCLSAQFSGSFDDSAVYRVRHVEV